jgi:hypothetical protein
MIDNYFKNNKVNMYKEGLEQYKKENFDLFETNEEL